MTVLQFRRGPMPRPTTPDKGPPSGEVYICGNPADGFVVIDVSASGGTVDTHGTFPSYGEAVEEGHRVAVALNRLFPEGEPGGAA